MIYKAPPRSSSLHWGVVIGIVILVGLVVIGSIVVFRGFGRGNSLNIRPTPLTGSVPTSSSDDLSTPLTEPGISCDEAVQRIEQDQIAYVIIHRNREGGPALPANAVTGIQVLPQGISYQGDPSTSNSLVQIFGTYPDTICYPQVLVAVKQVNQHLSKSEQVKVGWYYDLS